MRAVDIIGHKRDGQALDRQEIETFVKAATHGSWPDYQLAALLMAIVLRGMDADETSWLTAAMVDSGQRLDWSDLAGPKVGKHSTGGVGDKTSLLVVPLAAACGVIVPKTSGRGLGHTGGTLDKLEAIPGFRVALSLEELRAVVGRIGCALVGQTHDLVPADKVLYALRDVTATVESIPLITASILSKKIAEGIDGLVLDVKCGRGAFMKTRADAGRLAETLVAVGKAQGLRTEALLTVMDVPLGRAVGNSLEVIEALETLKGRGPSDLEELAVQLAARMLALAGSPSDAVGRIRAALSSGQGLEKFRQIVEQQGGDPRIVEDYSRLPAAPKRHMVRAARPGYVAVIDAERVGRAGMLLGAGRNRVEDAIDHSAGVQLHAHRGQQVKEGDALAELHYRDDTALAAAVQLVGEAYQLGEAPPPPQEMVLDTVT